MPQMLQRRQFEFLSIKILDEYVLYGLFNEAITFGSSSSSSINVVASIQQLQQLEPHITRAVKPISLDSCNCVFVLVFYSRLVTD